MILFFQVSSVAYAAWCHNMVASEYEMESHHGAAEDLRSCRRRGVEYTAVDPSQRLGAED